MAMPPVRGKQRINSNKGKRVMKRAVYYPLFVVLCAIVALTSSAAFALTGAVYTSRPEGLDCALSGTLTGWIVNDNIYPCKPLVFLNGGPQNLQASGLPPGIYYFQVTDPSGNTLLSTDPAVCRQVVVNSEGRVGGPFPANVRTLILSASMPASVSTSKITRNRCS